MRRLLFYRISLLLCSFSPAVKAKKKRRETFVQRRKRKARLSFSLLLPICLSVFLSLLSYWIGWPASTLFRSSFGLWFVTIRLPLDFGPASPLRQRSRRETNSEGRTLCIFYAQPRAETMPRGGFAVGVRGVGGWCSFYSRAQLRNRVSFLYRVLYCSVSV